MPTDTKTAEKPETVPTPEPAPTQDAAKTAGPDSAAKPAEPAKPELAPGNVWCRITKRGHDKVYTGQTKAMAIGAGEISPTDEGADLFLRYPYGTIVQFPLKIAQAQEDNGYLEIQED